jgi:hypothetical protein
MANGRRLFRVYAHVRVPLAIGLLLFALAACEAPTAPSDDTVETLSGTVQAGGFDITRFFAMKAGALKVRLQALTPGGTAVVGIAFGELNVTGKDCFTRGGAMLSAVNVGQVVTWPYLPNPVTEVQIDEGPHCIKVYDPVCCDRTLTPLAGPQSYTVQITHR